MKNTFPSYTQIYGRFCTSLNVSSTFPMVRLDDQEVNVFSCTAEELWNLWNQKNVQNLLQTLFWSSRNEQWDWSSGEWKLELRWKLHLSPKKRRKVWEEEHLRSWPGMNNIHRDEAYQNMQYTHALLHRFQLSFFWQLRSFSKVKSAKYEPWWCCS